MQQLFNQSLIEEDLSKELQRRKNRQMADERIYRSVCDSSKEIIELKQKINLGYINKQRCIQMEEKNYRKLESLQQDAQVDQIVLQNDENQQKKYQSILDQKRNLRYKNKDDLEKVIIDNTQKQIEAKKQYMDEKDKVQNLVNQMIDDDLKNYQMQQQKKKNNYRIMQETLEQKSQSLQKMKDFDREENEKQLQFYKMKDQNLKMHQDQMNSQQRLKDGIFKKLEEQKLFQEQQRRQLEDLREQLRNEEKEERERQLEIENQLKKENNKQENKKWEAFMLQQKQLNFQEEKRKEDLIKRQMEDKFQMENEKEKYILLERKNKEIQLKQQIEEQWRIKQQIFSQEKQNDLRFEKYLDKQDQFKQEIIQKEKEKLLKEHALNLQGFLPKGMIDSNYKSSPLTKQHLKSNIKIF